MSHRSRWCTAGPNRRTSHGGRAAPALACQARKSLRNRRRRSLASFPISNREHPFHRIRREPRDESPCHHTGFSAIPTPPAPWRTCLSPVSMTGKCGSGRPLVPPPYSCGEGAQSAAIWHRTGWSFTAKGTGCIDMVPRLRPGRSRREGLVHRAAESPLIASRLECHGWRTTFRQYCGAGPGPGARWD